MMQYSYKSYYYSTEETGMSAGAEQLDFSIQAPQELWSSALCAAAVRASATRFH